MLLRFFSCDDSFSSEVWGISFKSEVNSSSEVVTFLHSFGSIWIVVNQVGGCFVLMAHNYPPIFILPQVC